MLVIAHEPSDSAQSGGKSGDKLFSLTGDLGGFSNEYPPESDERATGYCLIVRLTGKDKEIMILAKYPIPAKSH